jgi:hypothetical protein
MLRSFYIQPIKGSDGRKYYTDPESGEVKTLDRKRLAKTFIRFTTSGGSSRYAQSAQQITETKKLLHKVPPGQTVELSAFQSLALQIITNKK